MRVPPAPRRITVGIALIMFAGARAGAGYCPMTLALAAAQGGGDSHDCCRSGLNSKAPACCHADTISNRFATTKIVPPTAPPVCAVFAWNLVSPFNVHALTAMTDGLAPAHSPPPAVLRI